MPRQPGQRADAGGNPGPGDAERRTARLLRGGGGQARGAGGAAREQRLRRDRARAVWRDRRADALERAASTDRAEDLACARGGERDGGEAVPARLLLHPPLRDSRFRSRTPGRSPQRRHRRCRHRPRPGLGPPGRQGHLHRIDRDRTPDRKRVRSPRSLRRPRARGQVPPPRLRRCRSRPRGGRDGAGRVRDDGAVLRLGGPDSHRGGLLRRVHGATGRRRGRPHQRRSLLPGLGHGPTHLRRRPTKSPRPCSRRARRGRPPRRRHLAPTCPRQRRLLHEPGAPRRRAGGGPHPERGDLRPRHLPRTLPRRN